ncbi:MAG: DUF748 domain-containing protein [Candidatus Binatia bacterium]
MAFRLSWPAGLRRWRRWIVTLLVLLAVRAALPSALRPLLVSQASQALRARVAIGDVDLSLLRCGLALNEVSIRPLSGADSAAEEQAIVSWKRFAVAVRWLPLLRKRVLLREVVLESPRVAVDRAEDGALNILTLVPSSTAPPDTRPTSAASPTPVAERAAVGSGWSVGADRVVLRDGTLRFRDFRAKGAEPLTVSIPELALRDLALGPGIYGDPSQLHATLSVEGGALDIRARLNQRQDGQSLDAEVAAQNIPLHRVQYYIPEVGLRTLDAWLDTDLRYRFDSKGQNEVRGTVGLRDLVIRMPNIEEPAIEYRLLKVTVDPVDLVARRVHVSDLGVDGVTWYVGRPGADRMPLVTAVLKTAVRRGAEGEGKTAQTAAATGGGAVPPGAPAWHWSLAKGQLSHSRLRLLRTKAALDVGVDATISDLADDAERPAPLHLALTVGAGSVNIDGALRLARLGFAGALRVVELPLAEILAAAAILPAGVLQAAELASELTVEAGMPVPDREASAPAPGEARLRGRLSLSGLRAGTPGAQGFSLTAKAIEVGIGELRAPGVVPGAGSQASSAAAPGAAANDLSLRGTLSLSDVLLAGADAKSFALGTRALGLDLKEATLPGVLPGPATAEKTRPMRIALGDLRIGGPSVRVTRTPEGIPLPSFVIAPAASSEPIANRGEASGTAQSTARPLEVTLDNLRLADGSVALTDRAVKPFFEGGIAPLHVDLRGVRWPPLAIEDLHVSATSPGDGTVTVAGTLDRDREHVELNAKQIALPPFNPYATTMAGYTIGGGKASIVTNVTADHGHYSASNALTLHNLDLRGAGGESLFQQTFGIPLSVALALMRDTNGDIALEIPVQMDEAGVQVGIGTIIRGALQRAIMGALASPLKLMGAVFGGGKVESVSPTAVAFRVGRSELAAGAAEQVEQLAALLASRPGIAVTLATVTTPADVRWLREQALLAAWDKEGFFGKMRDLPQRGARNAISAALEARKHDGEGTLDPEDAATLDRWLDERPAIPEARLQALSDARVREVERVLLEEHGLAPERIRRAPEPAKAAGQVPAVQLELGATAAP